MPPKRTDNPKPAAKPAKGKAAKVPGDVATSARAMPEADRVRRLNAYRLPEEGDARHETHLTGMAWLMRQRAEGRLGSAV